MFPRVRFDRNGVFGGKMEPPAKLEVSTTQLDRIQTQRVSSISTESVTDSRIKSSVDLARAGGFAQFRLHVGPVRVDDLPQTVNSLVHLRRIPSRRGLWTVAHLCSVID